MYFLTFCLDVTCKLKQVRTINIPHSIPSDIVKQHGRGRSISSKPCRTTAGLPSRRNLRVSSLFEGRMSFARMKTRLQQKNQVFSAANAKKGGAFRRRALRNTGDFRYLVTRFAHPRNAPPFVSPRWQQSPESKSVFPASPARFVLVPGDLQTPDANLVIRDSPRPPQ